jgi:hypothetical protein
MRSKLAMVESRPIFEGGKADVNEELFAREFWKDEIDIEKEKVRKAMVE